MTKHDNRAALLASAAATTTDADALPQPMPRTRDPIEDAGSTPEACAEWLRAKIAEAREHGQFAVAVIARPAFFDALCTPEFQPEGSNRKRTAHLVKRHTRTMRRGRWVPAHPSGLWFCEDGALGEGGHRSHAGKEARRTLVLWIAFGAPRAAMLVEGQDTKPRNAQDTFTIAGARPPSLAATTAAIRMLLELRDGAGADARLGNRSWESLDFWEAQPGAVEDAVHRGLRVYRGIGAKGISAATLAASLFLIAEAAADLDALGDFVDGLATGAGLVGGDPRLLCREGLRKRIFGRRAALVQDRRGHEAAAIILAWNAYRARRALRSAAQLGWMPGNPFPEVVA